MKIFNRILNWSANRKGARAAAHWQHEEDLFVSHMQTHLVADE